MRLIHTLLHPESKVRSVFQLLVAQLVGTSHMLRFSNFSSWYWFAMGPSSFLRVLGVDRVLSRIVLVVEIQLLVRCSSHHLSVELLVLVHCVSIHGDEIFFCIEASGELLM